MIERKIKKELLERLRWSPAVGIIGPRQSGKTTLVKSIFPLLPLRSVYLDLELPSDVRKLSDAEGFLRYYTDGCVVLDEIHRIPELFPVLRALIDLNRTPSRFILLGSSSPGIIRGTSESLAGRISYLELMPLNVLEVSELFTLREHWFKGGFPRALLASNENERKQWLEDMIRTYIERDLPQLGLSINPDLLHRFLSMIAHAQGGVWNAGTYAKSLGVSEPTVRRYLDFFEQTFIVHRLPPFYINMKKRLVKAPKLYLRDSGVLHRLLHIESFDSLIGHLSIGTSFEGYVVEQIKESIPSDISLYYYRTHHGSECDLVLVRGLNPIAAIEIKYSSAPSLTRGNTIALEDLGTENNFIITPASDDFLIRHDVRVCSLPVFLTEYLPRLGAT